LRGSDRGLKFIDSDPVALAASDIGLFFLALPDARPRPTPSTRRGRQTRRRSQRGFSHRRFGDYQKYYGEHHAPELLASARFVLPELTPARWKTEAKLVAAPGCYPTGILVPLVPLLKAGVVTREHIVVEFVPAASAAAGKKSRRKLPLRRARRERGRRTAS